MLYEVITQEEYEFNTKIYTAGNAFEDTILQEELDSRGIVITSYSIHYTKLYEFVEKQDYAQALNALFELKEPIDNFFEAVMVMDEDKQA